MTPVFVDYETYWSVTHSLTKMNPIEYVMHPETEIISCAIKVGDDPTYVIFGEERVIAELRSIDWSDKLLVAHNNEGFDAMISAWRVGIKPKMWGCTLAMSRPIHAKQAGGSLKALAEHYGLQAKGSLDATNTKGKHLKDFTLEEINAMRVYNALDTDICAALFKVLLPLTPKDEARLIDMTIRMLVEPQFNIDTSLLRATLEEVQTQKQGMLLDVACDMGWTSDSDVDPAEYARSHLASAAKFAAFLTRHGVEVPMKPSPTNPEKQTPALAKTDEAFLALQEHDNPAVAAAAAARVGVKSTILETRIQAFLAAAGAAKGKLPVPIKYYGADTTGRDSGWGYNPQNLPRVSGKPSDCLRNSLTAPPGYKVIVADLSGIELRVNMFLWKVPYAMKLFQESPDKADLYKSLASDVFNVPYDKVEKMQRQAAKAMHLGCGFGLGTPSKFQAVAKSIAGLEVSEEEAKFYIERYRAAHPEIVQGWKTCHTSLNYIAQGQAFQIDPWGLCVTSTEGIVSPRGVIRYPNLHQEQKDNGKMEWAYGNGRRVSRIYAGKITENVVQHLARNIIMGNALEFNRRTKLNTALRVHDELVYVVPADEAEEKLALLQSIMRTPPAWWPELVVWSEGDVADSYGQAK